MSAGAGICFGMFSLHMLLADVHPMKWPLRVGGICWALLGILELMS